MITVAHQHVLAKLILKLICYRYFRGFVVERSLVALGQHWLDLAGDRGPLQGMIRDFVRIDVQTQAVQVTLPVELERVLARLVVVLE